MSYLGNLTFRLAAGVMHLPEATRRRHAAFITAAERDDGGYRGREGPSDLYYTGFALRGLALAGELDEAAAGRAAAFLQSRLAHDLPAIDFLSLVSSAVLLEATHGLDVFAAAGLDRREAVTGRIERFRCEDGGYAKTAGRRQSSTYHTFLAVASLELIGSPIDQPDRLAELIRARQRDDGGFVELAEIRQSGTNPTAAAVGLLRLLGALEEPIRCRAADFLAAMQNAEGGLRANTRIPVADLLSTFTGLVALADMEALGAVGREAAGRYVAALEQPAGGFRGGAWDDDADVEYTFYGLGASMMPLIVELQPGKRPV